MTWDQQHENELLKQLCADLQAQIKTIWGRIRDLEKLNGINGNFEARK